MKTLHEVMQLTSKVSSETAFSDKECAVLYDCCHLMKSYSTVVEIGCQLGRTSSIIAQVGLDVGYHSIHIDPYTQQFEYLAGWIKMMHSIGNPFTLHCMRTDQVLPHTVTPIDLLLIDGDHTKHGVEEDLAFALHTVRRRGMILAHDYKRDSLPDVAAVLGPALIGPIWAAPVVVGTLAMWEKL